MFELRGIAISLSAFVLVYGAMSLAVTFWWRRFWRMSQKYPVRQVADLLFSLRILPLVAAVVMTLVFTVPSFLLLEPRTIDEPLGGIPLALGLCGIALAGLGTVNALLALRRASAKIAEWLIEAKVVDGGAVPVLRISAARPALTAAGILHPRVLISSAAEFLLSEKELKPALRHELVHVRRRDNLKKLVLRFVQFPGMAGLETAWLEATEMAADDAAVSNCEEALDLAAALIKLSRLSPLEPQAELTTSLVHRPIATVNARVERLIDWSEDRRVPAQKYSVWYALSAAVVAVAGCGLAYSHLLVRVHAATEWLIR
jgi:beta-lactamase regulating signal transducer with metallopeptidase domain